MHLFLTVAMALSAIAPSVSATCSTFTQTSDTYIFQEFSQNQTISAGITCTTNSSAYNTTTKYCNYVLGGSVLAQGFTNLTSSDADSAPLFPLIGSTNITSTKYAITSGNFFKYINSCLYDMGYGVVPGESGYYRWNPLLFCVNGTLGGCTNTSITDGTSLSICGAIGEYFANDNLTGTEKMISPLGAFEFIDTSAEVAAAMTTDPIANATCTAFYNSSAASAVGAGRLLAVSALVVLIMACL